MVAIKPAETDGFIRNPPQRYAVILVFGPDVGLVNERARALCRAAVADPDDPFQLVRLEGDDVAGDPLRLVDEANTIGLFGGRRAIWVKPTSRNLAPAVQPLLDHPPQDAVAIIEAGDLSKSAPLRTLCERAAHGAAIPCYSDGVRDVGTLVDQTLRDNGLTIGVDAREALIGLLGADRIASRGEIDKLVLYAMGQGTISHADIEAVIGDVSSLAMDQAIDSAFGGDFAALETAFARLASEGTDGGVLIGAALRHALLLLKIQTAISRGTPADRAVEAARVFYKRKDIVMRHARLWTESALLRAIAVCGSAVPQIRRSSHLSRELALHTLWQVAGAARRAPARR